MERSSDPFLVVGLGASAGGLSALESFFSGLPRTDGAAFVVVIHLDPNRESEMAEILGRSVPIPFIQVTEPVEVERGHVYVIPPDRNLVIEDGHLRLEPLEDERHRRRPIDHFFRTLAEAWGQHAVGVVLSGTGHNGTVGAARIRECGGLVLAQDPEEAAFDEMPRSVIASGIVDLVAPVADLARETIAYSDRLKILQLDGEADLETDGVEAIRHILAQLRAQTGHDFAHYKRATVLRRLARRLHVVGAGSLPEYLTYLREHPAEAPALLDDLLIHVTNFFRDPETFEALAEAIPELFEGKTVGDEVRVWVAGCATGEEAYSVAMLLDEAAAQLAAPPSIQVFATDLSAKAIQTARTGLYPESIEADVTPERLRTYFTVTPAGYRVRESLRERVLFAPHSLLKDPPFAHLDLVTCRNLLIYLQRDLQRRVLELFHYALAPGGLLFLGASETADATRDLFRVADKSVRLYRARDVASALPRVSTRSRIPMPMLVEAPLPAEPEVSVAELHQRLRAAVSAPSVLVDASQEAVHLSDGLDPFLQLRGGEPTSNVLRLVVPALRPAVQTALFQARSSGGTVTTGAVTVEVGGQPHAVRIEAGAAEGGLARVAFLAEPVDPVPLAALGDDAHAQALANELDETREQLQLTVEEFETSREELRAQNEELQSINEELRSTAEELETSKEEAQSMAEELQTVNDELKHKVEELAQASGDLENLIAATEIATLFLDRELRIQWFTPHVRHHFRIRSSDIGRPLDDLAQTFGGDRLVTDAEAVLAQLDVQQREVEGADGRWYLVQVRPYQRDSRRVEGVVVTFVDITERRRDEEAVRRQVEEFQALVSASAQIVWTCDAQGQIVEDSPTWRAFTGQTLAEWLGEGWAEAVHPDDRDRAVQRWRQSVATGEPMHTTYRLQHAGGWRWTEVRAVPLLDADGRIRGWVGANEDITEQHRSQAALQASAARADFRAGLADALRTLSDPVEVQAEAARILGEHLGASRAHYADVSADGAEIQIAADYVDGVPSLVGRHRLSDFGPLVASETRAGRTLAVADVASDERLTPEARDALAGLAVGALIAVPFAADDGVRSLFAVHQDTPRAWTEPETALVQETASRAWEAVERTRAERALRASEERFRETAETVPDVLFTVTADGDLDYVSAQFETFTGVAPETVLGARGWPHLVHPDDRAALEEQRAEAEAHGTPFEMRYRLRCAGGGTFWAFVRVRPVFDAAGALVRWSGTITDVDALTHAEQSVQALNDTLEARVAERTAQVRELATRLSSAEQAERQRLAHVLHDDLQQQLYGLSLLLLAARTGAPEESPDLVARAEDILADAIALTRTLSTDLSPTVLESESVEDLARWLADREQSRGRLRIDVQVTGAVSVADPSVRAVLYQALREVLFNVTKHAGTDDVVLSAEQSNGTVTVCVEDAGDGFDPSALPETGGFGLTSVRNRLALAGGRVEITSAPGEGTRVTLEVPSGVA